MHFDAGSFYLMVSFLLFRQRFHIVSAQKSNKFERFDCFLELQEHVVRQSLSSIEKVLVFEVVRVAEFNGNSTAIIN